MRLIHEKLMPDTATATIVTRQVQVGLRPTCPERSAHSIVAAF